MIWTLASQPPPEKTEPELNGDPPIHAIFRFLIAAVITWLANWAAATLSFSVFRDHLLFADLAYRAVGAALLIGIYSLLLTLLDHREGDRLAGQGLPLNRLARRQFLAGLAFGMLLIAICVAMVATFGQLSGAGHHNGAYAAAKCRGVIAVVRRCAAGRSHVPRAIPFSAWLKPWGRSGR